MSRKTVFRSLLVITSFSLVVFLAQRAGSPPELGPRPVTELQREEADIPSPTETTPSEDFETAARSLMKRAPTEEELRHEAREDAHSTPPSLIGFADELGELLTRAGGSVPKLRPIVKELHHCVLDDSMTVLLRTLCYTRARELTRTYPDLTSDFPLKLSEAPEEVRELLRKREILLGQ